MGILWRVATLAFEGWESHTYGDMGRWSYPRETIGPPWGEPPANNMGNTNTVGVEIWFLYSETRTMGYIWFLFMQREMSHVISIKYEKRKVIIVQSFLPMREKNEKMYIYRNGFS